jgi:hypothetical protein
VRRLKRAAGEGSSLQQQHWWEWKLTWEFLYVFPNLVLPDEFQEHQVGVWPSGLTLGSEVLAIVGAGDDRVSQIRQEVTAVNQLLGSFRTEIGDPFNPAVLIARSSAPERLKYRAEALVAFRNAIAVSVILRGRADAVRGTGGMSPTWADTFDFHPAQVSRTGRLVFLSPALQSLIGTDKALQLSPWPHLAQEGRRVWPDAYLYRVLGEEWCRQYERKKAPDAFGRSLFRSLEVAFSACSVGAKNEGSIHDNGLQVALWVSAIEILAWPKERHASFSRVLSLLREAPVHRALRVRRYRVKMKSKQKPLRVNALERAYTYLYLARNRFLHGNPVSPSLLFTRSRTAPAAIPRIAAVVYRSALAAYLNQRYPVVSRTLEEEAVRPNETFSHHGYSRALAESFGRNIEV